MADLKKLDSTITVNQDQYAVTAVEAETAKKLENTLTIKTVKEDGTEVPVVFDGSESKEITVAAGGGNADSAKTADEIKVYLDNNRTEYATITISQNDPNVNNCALGDIWFKYN